jgi:hypothetical protein
MKTPFFLLLAGSVAILSLARAAAPAAAPAATPLTPPPPASASAAVASPAPSPATPAAAGTIAPAKPATASASATAPKPLVTLEAKDAKLTAPIVLKDGVIAQPERTDLADSGKAVFEFTVPKDGSYEIYALVSAPDDENNSFFVNVDVEPKEEPLMIWDIDHTEGFEERVVNWRGNGEAGSGEFYPKVFKLTAGAHKLFLVGREPAKLKTVSVYPAAP